MTVSHAWYNMEVHDCSLNYQNVTLGLTPKADLGYEVELKEFQELMRCLALGTTTYFDFNPTQDEVKREISKILHKRASKVSKEEVKAH